MSFTYMLCISYVTLPKDQYISSCGIPMIWADSKDNVRDYVCLTRITVLQINDNVRVTQQFVL